MGKEMKRGTFRKLWNRYKYVALVVLAGAVLLAWPSGRKAAVREASAAPAAASGQDASVEETEARMQTILSRISGVGELTLMLSPESGGELQLAQDTELSYSGTTAAPDDYTRRSETVLASDGGDDTPVVTRSLSPTYRGALVVCQGANRADVKLAVTEAVAALTGLSSDRITVIQCQ